jgi:hypothetical protein
MQCPYCLEQIIDGALVCRFCGKSQPLTGDAKKVQHRRRRSLTIVAAVIVVGILMVWSASDYQNEQARLRAAAICNGNLTSEELEAIAKNSAAESGMSISQAERAAEGFACPSMAR